WVGGRLPAKALPPAVTIVVDLVAEYSAPRAIRGLPGYRALPVLDGGVPPDAGEVLALVRELVHVGGDVLVHCDSGRGRAPTMAAALLIARGAVDDVDGAVAYIAARRPVAAPTRSDLAFLEAMLPALRDVARSDAPRLHRHEAVS
ncbi:MAG: protein-tyrosine phosphatase family protein, partial [Candidatus Binatia bacterium]